MNRDYLPRLKVRPAVGVFVLTALAASLRGFRLDYWGLEGDEIFTLRDSLAAAWLSGPKPLIFFLNHHLIAPWRILDELGLRILPAVFGVAAIPVMYAMVRRTSGTRAGVLAALLLALHPLHLNWSQFARYYSLVFLLSTIFPTALLVGLKAHRVWWIVAACVTGGLAILAHPSSGLVVVGAGLAVVVMVAPQMVRGEKPPVAVLWSVGLALAAIAVVTIFWLGPRLWSWIDYNVGRWGHVGPVLALSYLDGLLLPFACFAAAGLLWMWRDGDKSIAVMHACVIGFPLVFLAGISPWVSVSTGYLIATTPSVFALAAFFLDRLYERSSDRYPGQLVATTCLVVIMAASVPRVVSQYRDGGRLDYRAAARHVEALASPDDHVLSDQPVVLSHYLEGLTVEQLETDQAFLDHALGALPPDASLWLVSPVVRRGGFREVNLGTAEPWVRAWCRLTETYAVSRLDYKHNELLVHRCWSKGFERTADVEDRS